MARYVFDTDVIKVLTEYYHQRTETQRRALEDAVSRVPDADVVEVVRCKDCKWYDISSPYGTVIPDAYHCKVNDRFYDSEHFCGYGERRE